LHSLENYLGVIPPNIVRWKRPAFYQAAWHGIGLGLVLFIASHVAWGGNSLSDSSPNGPLVVLALSAYLLALWANWRMLHFPVQHYHKVVLANLGLAFLIALGLLAFGRFYYSRSFLLAAFVLSLSWQWLGLWLSDKTKLRLAVVPGGAVEKLLRLQKAEWVLLTKPAGLVMAAGIVVDSNAVREPEWIRFLANCALRGLPVYDAGSVYETMTGRALLDHNENNLPEQCAPPSLYLTIKQMVDVALVVASLPIVLPLIGLIALFIRLDSTGPAFFWQERVGKAGRIFCMVKFRTMDISDDQGTPRFAVAEDYRITRLGRWLRRFRLDELPQIWNVLRGEMSLIGPRPEQVPFAHLFAREIPLYPCRHLVKPGISGWAQVNQGYAAGSDETRIKLAYDLYYVKHCSFWLDALIALRTPRTIQTGHGAR
jgi:lipopolysaccharide/colanic/teichoic acid biosynthesis glycosyltransferase